MDIPQLPAKHDVLSTLFSLWQPANCMEAVPVSQALSRIPTGDMRSKTALPVVRASAMDGIAVDAARFVGGIPDASHWKPGLDYVWADTGDDFDDGFNAVIKVEDVEFLEGGGIRITPQAEVKPGINIRLSGEQIQVGDPLVRKHLPLLPKDLAMLLMGGFTEIEVLQKPRVAIVPTGSELVPPGTPPGRGTYTETSSLFLAESLKKLGAEPLCLPIVPDDTEKLESALREALKQADIVVMNGGSSKGHEDSTAALLKKHGQVVCPGVAAAPGRPMCIAVIAGKPVINLPGPLVAAYYGMEWCLNAIVSHFLRQPTRERQKVKAILTEDLNGPVPISFLFKMDIRRDESGVLLATPLTLREVPTWRFIQANGQYMSKLGGEHRPKGSEIEVELLRGMEYLGNS